jgi:hypothetical protein
MISERCERQPETANTKDFPMTDEPEQKDAKKDAKEPRPIIHLGMMGDGTEVGERGNPAQRIKEDEVEAAFNQPAPNKKP